MQLQISQYGFHIFFPVIWASHLIDFADEKKFNQSKRTISPTGPFSPFTPDVPADPYDLNIKLLH